MSLVICSNNTDEQSQTAGQDGSIFKPWSFRNDMSSNMSLPADCQVALQSAKIHMDGSISLGDLSSRTFYWWFGKVPGGSMGATSVYFAPDIRETTSQAVKVVLFANEESKVETNIIGLKNELQAALNRSCFHPNLHSRIVVNVKYDAGTGQFTGFEFNFNEEITTASMKPVNRIPYNDTSMVLDALSGPQRRYQVLGPAPTQGREIPPYSVTRVVGDPTADPPIPAFLEMTMNVFVGDKSESVVLNVPPLNLKGEDATSVNRGGQAAFNISKLGPGAGKIDRGKFAVGLSRPALEQFGNARGGRIYPSWYHDRNGGDQPEWMNYFDYAVGCNMLQDEDGQIGSEGHLRLFHAVANSRLDTAVGGDPQSTTAEWLFTPKIQALKYGDGTGTTEDTGCDPRVVGAAGFTAEFGYDYRQNALAITGVVFTVSAQRVLVQLYDKNLLDGTHIKYTIASYDASRPKKSNLKPVDQGCWSLLPQVTINNEDAPAGEHTVKFERFDGVDNLYTDTTGGTWDMLSYGAGPNPATGSRGIGGINEGRSSWELVNGTFNNSDVMVREINDRRILNYNVLADLANQYVYDEVGATAPFNFTRQKQVLILQEQPIDNFPHTELASATRLLGFVNRSVVDFSVLNAAHNFVVDSITVPQLLPTSSIFVRLHGFNQETTNAKARGKSDIIAHLPRFDGLASSGPLYLEPNNLVYLDLNNPNEIKVNSFDLSLCYSNEQYAENLTGTTIIVLHFRAKPK